MSNLVLSDYEVGKVLEENRWYNAIINDVRVETVESFVADQPCDDYSVMVDLCVMEDEDSFFPYTVEYPHIWTKGRTRFQLMAEDFELFCKNRKGMDVMNLRKLLGQCCQIRQEPEDASITMEELFLGDEAEEKHYRRILGKAASVNKEWSYQDIPKEVNLYYDISLKKPYKEFTKNKEYDAYITGVELEEKEDKVTVIIKACLFNGSFTKMFSKYINDIYGDGRRGMDPLITQFDLINQDGKVDLSLLEGQLALATVFRSRTDKQYISRLEPVEKIHEIAYQQFERLAVMKQDWLENWRREQEYGKYRPHHDESSDSDDDTISLDEMLEED